MPPLPGMMHWHSLLARHAKSLRTALDKGLKALDIQLSGKPKAVLEPIYLRNTPKQPLHPLARIRQNQSRWYSTARTSIDNSVRQFTSTAGRVGRGVKYDKSAFPNSAVRTYIQQSSGRAPFASTLRPNLTGGTLGRTAGGYTLGSGRIGGARHFSHGPASQAQVVQNVSQALRAFFISGQKAHYDGVSPFSGGKRYTAVSALRDETSRKMQNVPKSSPGSRVEFPINPTITALTPLAAVTGYNLSHSVLSTNHLNTEGLLDVLSSDFSRALKDLAVVLNDLKRLSSLGDLPITCEGSCMRVHFPGCDANTVEHLCMELGVQRGCVIQDEAFDAFAGTEIALLFPFAPSDEESLDDSASDLYDASKVLKASQRRRILIDDLLSRSQSSVSSTPSENEFENILHEDLGAQQDSSPSGYQSVRSGSDLYASSKDDPLEYQGFEGIYRFIEALDATRR